MAHILVIYESMFGDAKQIAEAIARGLAEQHETDCIEVGVAPTSLPDDLALLVVGSPTHGFGLPRESSRADAAAKTDQPVVSSGIGVREWLDQVTPPGRPIPAVTFDTRMTHPKMLVRMDHASATAAKHLRKLGFTLAADSEHFHVQDVQGPLVPGEVDRAQAWGVTLANLTT